MIFAFMLDDSPYFASFTLAEVAILPFLGNAKRFRSVRCDTKTTAEFSTGRGG
jgi:hypothetical protein